MKKLLLQIAAVAIFISVVGIVFSVAKNRQAKDTQEKRASSITKVTINNIDISVEVVKSLKERQKGLSNRNSLVEYEGMLFIFEEDKQPVFWMKDMKFPIDIIWIDDFRIAKIDNNIPPPVPGTTDEQLVRYRPNQPIDYVLEVNAGFTDKQDILVGDYVQIF